MKPILEHIKLSNNQSILAFEYVNDYFETPWHFHPQYELTYIDESDGTKFIGDYVGPFEPGELVLLRSNLPHCWKNVPKENVNARSTVIQWNANIFSRVPELENVFEMFGRASRGLLFSYIEIKTLLPLLKTLPRLEGNDLYIQHLLLLNRLSKCSYTTLSKASYTQRISSKFESRITNVHEFVHNHYHRKIYLKEVAQIAKMSESSFSRFFSKVMGKPFFVFLNEYRTNMAARMLIDTRRTVAEIGYATGYESLPFFYKQFKTFKHSAPSAYRKKYSPK